MTTFRGICGSLTAIKVVVSVFLLSLSCSLSLAAVTCAVPNPNHHQGIGTMPLWFSGTNCDACGIAGTNTPGARILLAELWINGTLVKSGSNYPLYTPAQLSAIFDSTHFSDGSGITITIKTWDSAGGYNEASNSANAYNKAFAFGNDNEFAGTTNNGVQVTRAAEDDFTTAKHSLLPSERNATPYWQTETNIKDAIPSATAFFGCTHGASTEFGDSYASATLTPTTSVSNSEVTTAVGNKTTAQPPYNFVCLMACCCGGSNALARAFGVITSTGGAITDRVFLGWTPFINDEQRTVDWTDRLFQKLAEGKTLRDAISYANDPDGNPATEDRVTDMTTPVNPTTYGDLDYKLHGVYGKPNSLDWYR